MEIQWKHVAICILVLVLLINLGAIVDTLAGIITDVVGALDDAMRPLRHHHRSHSPTYALARLAILGILVVGILRLFRRK